MTSCGVGRPLSQSTTNENNVRREPGERDQEGPVRTRSENQSRHAGRSGTGSLKNDTSRYKTGGAPKLAS